MALISIQTLLSEYLQYDLYHSIGAYGVARDRLAELEEKMRRTPLPQVGETADHEVFASDRDARERSKLLLVTRLSRQFNDKLVRQRHFAPRSAGDGKPDEPKRMIPDEYPLTLSRRFDLDESEAVEDARRNPWARPHAWGWVLNFYDAAIAAIEIVDGGAASEEALKERNPQAAKLVRRFADSMVLPRDRLSRNVEPLMDGEREERERRRRWLRRARFEERRRWALDRLPGIPRDAPQNTDAAELIARIASDNLGSGYDSVPLFVLSATTEAHLIHHAVEAWKSMPLGLHAQHAAPHLRPPPGNESTPWNREHWLHKELDRSIALETFAYSASRCAPWMFAANDAECEQVFGNLADCWTNFVPTRCMWISM